MKKSRVSGFEHNMFAIIILFCISFAASVQIDSPNSDVDILLGNDVQLKWTFTTAADETQFISGDIELRSATQSDVNVAVFTTEFSLSMYDPYGSRLWTATRPRDKKEILLNVRDAKTEDDGLYSLKLSYLKGSRPTSDKHGIRLNVLVKPHYPTGSSYDSGPKTSDEGKSVTIKCEPEGSPKPIKIIWEKNNAVFREKDTNDPNLMFDNVTRSDTGTYVCKASNKAGNANMNPSTQLTIKYKPVNTEFIAKSPLLVGTTVNLECSAEADPKAVYSISGGGIAPVSGSKTGIFPLQVDLSKNGGEVTCTPSNRLGNGESKSLILDVQVPPKVIAFPSKWDAIEGRNISAKCDATGKPAPDIVWIKNGAPLRNMPKDFISGKDPSGVFITTSTLTLSPAKRTDNGNYGCQAKNKYGNVIKTVRLELKYLPEVTLETKNDFKNLREIRKGEDVKLTCRAKGNPETTYYVWRWENGTVIQNKSSGVLEFKNIQPHQGGRLSCAGSSYIGEGDKAHVNVDVRVPPSIIVHSQPAISLNESKRLQLFCNATGVPEPTIHWSKDGKDLRYTGERLSIYPVKYTDRGSYLCTADNGIPPNASALTIVTIYFRPVIQTTSAAETLLGAESGETVTLVCTAVALPQAQFKWLAYPSMHELNTTLPDILEIKQVDKGITMKVKARYGAKYLCFVYNDRGNDTQIFEIRPKGKPEAPHLDSVKTDIHNTPNELSTVRADLKWIPGYNGGQKVSYIVYYVSRADQSEFTSTTESDCNCYTITQNLEANKDYIFYVQARNTYGPSNGSNQIRQRTKAFFGSASVERLDEGKIVKVSFVIYTSQNLTKEVRFRENTEDSDWERRTTAANVQQPLVIEDLDPEKHYLFQVLWHSEGETQITDGGEVVPWNPHGPDARSSSPLSKEEIIAVIAGVGGFLLIVILVLFLCLIRRRQKPKRDETVVVMRRQPQSVDVVTRRSLIGSVEDDPFESAHYGTQDKKKARETVAINTTDLREYPTDPDSYYLPDSEDMNTFTGDEHTAKRGNPTESSKAYQPYIIGQKSRYKDDERSSSDDDSDGYKKQLPSDDEMSSEPGYARVAENGKVSRDKSVESRDQSRPNPNSIYAKVDRGNNNRPMSNGRGAPPPYRPRSTADSPLPPYPDDHLDLDDPSAAPFDDPLPPPMPVLPNSRSIPDAGWNDRYVDYPFDSVDSTMERQKSASRTSLGSGKPYINAQGKLVRPGSRHSSSDHFSDSEQRLPEPEVPTARSRHTTDNDQSNLVSYLV